MELFKIQAAAAEKMCEDISGRGMFVDALCVDRGSKAKSVFPNVILQDDDWHDLTKLDASLKEQFKNVPNFSDKVVVLRY